MAYSQDFSENRSHNGIARKRLAQASVINIKGSVIDSRSSRRRGSGFNTDNDPLKEIAILSTN